MAWNIRVSDEEGKERKKESDHGRVEDREKTDVQETGVGNKGCLLVDMGSN